MKTVTQWLQFPTETISDPGFNPDWILVFSNESREDADVVARRLQAQFPGVLLTGCSTAGSIDGRSLRETGSVVQFLRFEKGEVRAHWVQLEPDGSEVAGKALAAQLNTPELEHLIVLSDGLNVNGTALVQGLTMVLGHRVSITGGLAGDGDRFRETWVYNALGSAQSDVICGIGLYKPVWEIGFGSMGGWSAFGIERLVTRSRGNVLYEIDGQPALDLYKSYLGERSADLPASGLLFPLSIRINAEDRPVVRTILGIDETQRSLIFAGDIPQGSYAKLMNASVDRLLRGAEAAAQTAVEALEETPEWALLVSCVGRKLVLKQMVEEELEWVESVVQSPAVSGFYSYGEIAPFRKGLACDVHNQTMTITTFRER